jgi:hypothetical protein
MQTKSCWTYLHHIRGWSGLPNSTTHTAQSTEFHEELYQKVNTLTVAYMVNESVTLHDTAAELPTIYFNVVS